MKIGIDIRTAAGEKAGKGWYTFNLVEKLLSLDNLNSYFLYTKEKIPGFERFKNARQVTIRGNGILWHLKASLQAKKDQIEVFFAPSSYLTPIFLPEKIKTLLTVHDLVAFKFPNTHNKKAVFLEKLLLKTSAKKAKYILPVSLNTQNDLSEKFPQTNTKLKTIHCAPADFFETVDKNSLQDFIKNTNLPNKFFLAVGTLEPRKNYINLIKAFKKVRAAHPAAHLLIVGGKGWQYKEIFDLVKNSELSDYVHFLGYLSNTALKNLYNLAVAFVFPSFYEGFGIPPLEAMSCGCPVIASNTSSLPEVVGDAGILVNPEKVQEIASAMIQILESPQLAEKLSKKGLVQSGNFSWNKSAKELLSIINSCHQK